MTLFLNLGVLKEVLHGWYRPLSGDPNQTEQISGQTGPPAQLCRWAADWDLCSGTNASRNTIC